PLIINRACQIIGSTEQLARTGGRPIALATPGVVTDLPYQLATGSADIVRAGGAHSHCESGFMQYLPKIGDRRTAWTTVIRLSERIERNQVYLAGIVLQQLSQFAGVLPVIIDTCNQCV